MVKSPRPTAQVSSASVTMCMCVAFFGLRKFLFVVVMVFVDLIFGYVVVRMCVTCMYPVL